MVLDRPFMLAITDQETGTVLFLARMGYELVDQEARQEQHQETDALAVPESRQVV